MDRRWFLRGIASLPFVGVAAATVAPAPRALATGGVVPAAGRYLVGEHGIEIVVNAGMGANGREIGDRIVECIRGYERRNGNGWRV